MGSLYKTQIVAFNINTYFMSSSEVKSLDCQNKFWNSCLSHDIVDVDYFSRAVLNNTTTDASNSDATAFPQSMKKKSYMQKKLIHATLPAHLLTEKFPGVMVKICRNYTWLKDISIIICFSSHLLYFSHRKGFCTRRILIILNLVSETVLWNRLYTVR